MRSFGSQVSSGSQLFESWWPFSTEIDIGVLSNFSVGHSSIVVRLIRMADFAKQSQAEPSRAKQSQAEPSSVALFGFDVLSIRLPESARQLNKGHCRAYWLA